MGSYRKHIRQQRIIGGTAMIEDQFVSFDKEAGFDVPCFNQYTERGTIWHCDCPENFNKSQCVTSCPTQALAERWLREVYNVAIYSLYDDDMGQWFYVVDAFTKNPVINGFQSDSEYDDYESAFEDGLREAIKRIKKQ